MGAPRLYSAPMGWLERLTRPSRDRFGRIAQAALERYGAPAPIVYETEGFLVRVGDGAQRFFLDNAYKDYCAASFRGRKDVLAGYFNIALMTPELPARYADAKPDLLPKVRERFWRESLRLHAELPPAGPCQRLTDEYEVEVVWDQPLTMATV